jgi:hypothetical protein
MSNFNCLQQYFLRYNQNAKPPGADRVLLIRKRPKSVARKKRFYALEKVNGKSGGGKDGKRKGPQKGGQGGLTA